MLSLEGKDVLTELFGQLAMLLGLQRGEQARHSLGGKACRSTVQRALECTPELHMQVIDVDRKGNVVRCFLGKNGKPWGDGWHDAPALYERYGWTEERMFATLVAVPDSTGDNAADSACGPRVVGQIPVKRPAHRAARRNQGGAA